MPNDASPNSTSLLPGEGAGASANASASASPARITSSTDAGRQRASSGRGGVLYKSNPNLLSAYQALPVRAGKPPFVPAESPPIGNGWPGRVRVGTVRDAEPWGAACRNTAEKHQNQPVRDRKSTRLNSSH